jgi:hypothetical protein
MEGKNITQSAGWGKRETEEQNEAERSIERGREDKENRGGNKGLGELLFNSGSTKCNETA